MSKNIAPKLVVDWKDVVGNIVVPPEFSELDRVTQADLLRDWLYDIQKLYDRAVSRLCDKREINE